MALVLGGNEFCLVFSWAAKSTPQRVSGYGYCTTELSEAETSLTSLFNEGKVVLWNMHNVSSTVNRFHSRPLGSRL